MYKRNKHTCQSVYTFIITFVGKSYLSIRYISRQATTVLSQYHRIVMKLSHYPDYSNRAVVHTRTYVPTYARTHARTHARTQARTYTRTHARPHARTHARTHLHQTHTYTHILLHTIFDGTNVELTYTVIAVCALSDNIYTSLSRRQVINKCCITSISGWSHVSKSARQTCLIIKNHESKCFE